MFTDAQQMHKNDPDFYAPDLALVEGIILRGDLIKVCETDDDGENGERYWIEVTMLDWPAIYGKVRNELIVRDRKLHDKLMVESVNLYDFQPQPRYTGTEADPNFQSVGTVSFDTLLPFIEGGGKGSSEELNPRYDIEDHSPDGFSWGYGGSGPAQLALAILAHATDKETALKHYQDYKFGVIAKLAGNWTITASMVDDWLSNRVC